ncbi:hypothetical protein V8F20_010619 [Naviculisporaceae sp. PSN 640]
MTVTAATSSGQGSQQNIPRLTEPLEVDSSTGNSTPRAAENEDKKGKKRSLFGFGRKKTDESASKSPPLAARSEPKAADSTRRTAASPIQTETHSHPFMPSSPGRALTSSPRLSSPAGSQIFERDVQESTAVLPNSPAIPSHITTENYIPPVLDASSEAITDDHLDPDSVEIITHTLHQPAALTVTGAGNPLLSSSQDLSGSWTEDLAASDLYERAGNADSASNYGSLDTTDVRRLSFISFADVVQSEQAFGGAAGQAGSRDSVHIAGLTSLSSLSGAGAGHRSPSPIRSPVSSSAGGPGTSPPTSKSGSVKGLELSPARAGKPLGSPTLAAHHSLNSPGLVPASPTGGVVSGELAIETMTQALRRTGSGDLGVGGSMRSLPTSPV